MEQKSKWCTCQNPRQMGHVAGSSTSYMDCQACGKTIEKEYVQWRRACNADKIKEVERAIAILQEKKKRLENGEDY